MSNPKVYVTYETDFDFAPAEKYGELEFVTCCDIHNPKGSPHNRQLLTDIMRCLRTFNPETDYILPVGSPYVQACVFWVLGLKNIREINLLRWSNRDRIYIPVHLKIPREDN